MGINWVRQNSRPSGSLRGSLGRVFRLHQRIESAVLRRASVLAVGLLPGLVAALTECGPFNPPAASQTSGNPGASPGHTAPPPTPAPTPSAAPDAGPPALGVTEARARVEPLWRGLLEPTLVDPRLEPGPAEPGCDKDGCRYAFEITFKAPDGERIRAGIVYVDAKTGEPSWQPNDGRDKRWSFTAFDAFKKKQSRVLDAASRLTEVKSYCALLARRKVGCLVWVEEPPDVDCPTDPPLGHECLWSVYVGENQSTHSVRFATVYVDPNAGRVVGAAPIECDPMSPANFRSYFKAYQRSSGKAARCP